MKHLFVYGSLMFDEVWNRLIKFPYEKLPAELEDYQRLIVRGETYPGLIENPLSKTQGVLVLNLKQKDLMLLDRFEGAYYQRKSVIVNAVGQTYSAEVYVFKQMYKNLLSEKEWNEGIFKRQGLRVFVKRYGGWK